MEGSSSPDVSSPEMQASVEAKPLGLEYFGRSIGKDPSRPDLDEDAIARDPKNGIAMVLDGVGGLNAGEKASRAARSVIAEKLKSLPLNTDPETAKRIMSTSILEASQRVVREVPGGGATATVVKFIENGAERRAIIGHIGDSRAYILRGGTLRQITEDDSVLSLTRLSLVDRKRIGLKLDQVATHQDYANLSDEERSYWDQRNGISQMVGDKNPIKPHVYHVALQDGDKIIITSDGIHDNLTPAEIDQIVKSNPADLATTLTEKAKARSQDLGHVRHKTDDISAIVVNVEPRGTSFGQVEQNQVRKLDQVSRPAQPERQAEQNQSITQMQELLKSRNLGGYTEVSARRSIIEAATPDRINNLTPDQAHQLIQLYAQYNDAAKELNRVYGNNKDVTNDKFNQAMRSLFQKAGRPYPQRPWWAGGGV